MNRTAIIASAFAFLATAASAADFNAAKAVCADAIAAETGKSLDGGGVKLVRARDGAVLRVTVRVSFSDGAAAQGECKVKRGEVLSMTLLDKA